MARINTYQIDGSISANDIVIGSEYNGINSTGIPIYKTKNYRMSDLQTFLAGGDFEFAAPITIQTLPAGNKKWVHDTQSLTSTSSSVTLYAKDNYAENTPETFSSVTGVTTNTTGHLTGYVLTTFTMPEEYSFNVIGDASVNHSGSGSVDSQSQTINFEQTLTISGGDAWISTLSLDSAADKVSIYHNNVSRTDVNNTSITLEHDSVFKAVSPTGSGLSYQEAILSDAKGHLLGEKITQYTLPDYKFNIAADSTAVGDPAFTTSIDIHSTSIDTLSVLASAPISSIITADDTITISHDEYTAKSITTDAVDVLHTFVSDAYGHVTEITKRTLPTFGGADTSENIAGSVGVVPAPAVNDELKFLRGDADWATPPGTYSFNINADNDSNPVSNKEITSGQTLNILGATPISTAVLAADTVTISATDFTGPTSVNGVRGLVPAPTTSDGSKFLKGNGGWAVPTDTQYSVMGSGDPASYAAGLVLTGSATHDNNFLRKDGSWAAPPGTFSLLLAADGTRGGVQIGYSANGTNYPVKLTQEKMYVNVPTYSAAISNAAGTTGLMPGAAAGQQNFLMTGGGVWRGLTFTRTGKQYNNSGNPVIGIDLSDDGNRTSFTISHADTNSQNQLSVSNTGKNVIQSITIDPYGHITDMSSGDMSYASSDFNHNDLSGVDDNEHKDWTTDQGSTNIHSGNYTNTTYSIQDGELSQNNFTNADHTKLDGIEVNATADQTPAQLRTAIGIGNGNLVPPEGTAGHFLKHDGTFGATPYTVYYGQAGIDVVGFNIYLDVTGTSADSFFQIPFFNSTGNALSRDSSTSGSMFFNPNSDTLSVKQISLGTTSTLTNRSIYSQSSGSNYFEIANTSTSNGGRLLFGCTTSGFNGIYSRNHNNSAGREFRLIQLSNTVITVATNGDTTVNGDVTANDFIVISDKRLKSEIEPIKEGLEVIKKFSSYNYIKCGEKESGFIAQEVREAIPHTVYENNDGYLSMSDRGVVAHMHKAILELEERLIAIEEKLK